MYESSLEHLRCVRCGQPLELDTYEKKSEIWEGLLSCIKCTAKYPIISSIPILIDDLSSYFSVRMKLGGFLMLKARNRKTQSLIKESLRKIKQVSDDTTNLEKNWANIYKRNQNSLFVKKIKNAILKLPRCDYVIEHGCSIGITSENLAKHNNSVFGIDKSFFALIEAKKRKLKNADFFVADSLMQPFGNKKFGMVVALNVLELIEPALLLKVIFSQSDRFVILSDPYDYDRGKNSVKVQLYQKDIRAKFSQNGFKLIHGTKRPSFSSWNLSVNQRLSLHYKVDIVVAEKS